MFKGLNKLICKLRGYHDWRIIEYHDGTDGSYFVTKCSCCGLETNYPLKSEWHNYFPEGESEPDEEKERILKERLLNGIKNDSYM